MDKGVVHMTRPKLAIGKRHTIVKALVCQAAQQRMWWAGVMSDSCQSHVHLQRRIKRHSKTALQFQAVDVVCLKFSSVCYRAAQVAALTLQQLGLQNLLEC